MPSRRSFAGSDFPDAAPELATACSMPGLTPATRSSSVQALRFAHSRPGSAPVAGHSDGTALLREAGVRVWWAGERVEGDSGLSARSKVRCTLRLGLRARSARRSY